MDKIIQHLKDSERILVASHANPDGDAIGSLIAMGLALDALHKTSLWHNPSPIPAVYRFLQPVERISQVVDPNAAFDTAIILDCGDIGRVGPVEKMLTHIDRVINIDHHVTNTNFGDDQLIDTSACATSEIIYRLITRMQLPISAEMALAMYTGILTDTGSFRFSNTNQSAFEICNQLVAYGVEPFKVAQHVYGTYSLGRIKLLNLALDTIEISGNGQLSMMTVTQRMLTNTGTHPEDADGLINYARRIEDVKVAALIQEQRNGSGGVPLGQRFHVSLRSDGSIDVAAIAAAFGGGGHPSAAGFSIESTLAELKSTIITLSENFNLYAA